MTKETQQDYINPISKLIDDIVEYVNITSLVQELEEEYPEMLTDLAAIKEELSHKEYWRHILMWFVEKDKFFDEILLSYECDEFLYDLCNHEPENYPSMGYFSYSDYGFEPSSTIVYVFEYGSKYIYICYNKGDLGSNYSYGVVDSLEEIEDIFSSLDIAYGELDSGLTNMGEVSASYWIKGKEICWSYDGNTESDDYLKIETDFVFKVTEEKPIEDAVIHGFEYFGTLVKGDINIIQHGAEQDIEEDIIEEMSEQLSSSTGYANLEAISVDRSEKSLTITITLYSSKFLDEQMSDEMSLTLSVNGEKKILSNVT